GAHQLPLLLRHRDHHAGPEKTVERQVADACRALHQVDRRVHVGRGVHHGGEALRHGAVLGVMRDALELDVLVAGHDRRVVTPRMAELVKLYSRDRIDEGRHELSPAMQWPTAGAGWPSERG